MSRLRASIAWLVPAVALVGSCGWLGLIEPTETRYAEIAREMLASGDWLIPRLNGIPHFHKPPLSYWLSAAGMGLLGVNEWGARLGVALAAGFVLWCTARMARQAGGALAPAFLVSTILFFALSHQLGSDIFLAAAVAGFYAAVIDPRARATLWPFVALGVGFMAKGPVVFVLTVAPALLASAWARDGSPARALASWRGWLVFAAIGLPWYLVVMIKTPGLLTYFLHRQLWERYATTLHQRGGPIYYFLVVILVGAIPWTWAALHAWWHAAREAGGRRNLPDALLASWVGLPILFFSSSRSKLPAYVLPLFPALAVLASTWPKPERRGHWLRIALVTFAVLLALLAAATPFSSQLGSPRALAQSIKDIRRPGEHVVEYGVFNAGIPFYLGETVPMLEVERDLELEGAEGHGAIITRGDFASMVNTQGRVWVVGKEAAVQALADTLGFKATRMAGSGKQTLLLVEQAG